MSVNLNTSAPAKLPDLPEVADDKSTEVALMPQIPLPPTTAPVNNNVQPSTPGGKGYVVNEKGSSTPAVENIYKSRNGKSDFELQSPSQNKPETSPTDAQQNRSIQPTSGTQVPANTPVKSESSVTQTNKLQGRDPDLIFAGDKIKLSNGEIYTAKSTDTLSGIASKTGNSLESLIKQNGFDSQLLGKNTNGKYFDLKQEQQRVQQMPVAPGGSVNSSSSQGKNTSASSQSTTTIQSSATQQLDAASSALKKLQAGETSIKGEDLTKLIQLLTKFIASLQDSKSPALSTEEFKNLGVLAQKYNRELNLGQVVDPAATTGSPTPTDPKPVAKPEPEPKAAPQVPDPLAPPNKNDIA
jgi:LysM domain